MAEENQKQEQTFDCLAVTSVQVFPFRDGPSLGRIKGLAQVVLNDQFLVRGLRIMDGENGLYISYPFPFHPTTGENGQPRSTVFPITKALRDHVEAVVIEKYQDAVKKENG